MTKYEDLIKLVMKVSDSVNYFNEGAVFYEGYGFAFRDFEDLKDFISPIDSVKLYNFSSTRDLLIAYEAGEKDFGYMYDLGDYDDLLLAGAVKTLVPNLKFGGDEIFFQVCIIVRTPNSKLFPIILYYGKSRLAIGGWKSNFQGKFFNVSELTLNELDDLASKLESALLKISPSNYKGKYHCEAGTFLMGVKNHDAFIEKVEEEDYSLSILILDNDESWEYYDSYLDIIKNYLKEQNKDPSLFKNNKEIARKSFNYCLDKLVNYAKRLNNRIGFQILGYIIMKYNGDMTNEIINLVLENSHWEDELHLYKNEKYWKMRKTNLTDFYKKVENYEYLKN
ncbi:MAG: hypothetical protein ACW96X_01195 [Promethearchaeota archaeon]|jgi:hypothetical protein